MKQTLIIVTIAHSCSNDITPLLLETLSEAQLQRVSLLDGLPRSEIDEKYAPQGEEETLTVRLADGAQVQLAARRVAQDLQQLICQLEKQGAENILLLGCGQLADLQAESALLLDPDRLIPPLIKTMIEGSQAGIMVPADEPLRQQAVKWRNLSKPARFAVVTPSEDNEALIDAGILLLEQGAEVIVLDGAGYRPQQGELLQQLLGIPVLLAWRPLAEMAAELLA